MKKRILGVLILITVIICAMCLNACQVINGSGHTHTFEDYVSNGDATCAKDGTKTAKCTGCDVTDTIPDVGSKKEHKYGEFIAEVPASCKSEGTKGHYECSECHKSFDAEKNEMADLKIDRLPHVFDRESTDEKYLSHAADCTNAAEYFKSCVCGERGTVTFEHGEPLGHNAADEWTYENGHHWKVCENGCETKQEYGECSGGTATCTHGAVCSVCGHEYEPATSHSFDSLSHSETEHWGVCSCGEEGPAQSTNSLR